jgi:hypothetical protein
MTELPIFQTTSSKFEYTIKLDNEVYLLRYEYNPRSFNWYLTISNDRTGQRLDNKKLIINYPLYDQNKAIFNVMPGDVLIQQVNNTEELITYDNLGIDYIVYYYTADEVTQWKIDNDWDN